MFEGKRGLKIAIYVKGFSEKEKRLFPDCNQRAQTDGFAEQNGRDAERADLTCRY